MTTVGDFHRKLATGEPLTEEEQRIYEAIQARAAGLREKLAPLCDVLRHELRQLHEKLAPQGALFGQLWEALRRKSEAITATSEHFRVMLADPRVQADAEVYAVVNGVYERLLDAHIGMLHEELAIGSEAVRLNATRAAKMRHKESAKRHASILADYERMRRDNPKLSKNRAAAILANTYNLSVVQARRIIGKKS